MDNGFTLYANTVLADRPAWLATRPTVLYYDERSKPAAETLAKELAKVTGDAFSTERGAGLGIPKGQERESLRVHFVGSQR